MRIRIVEPLVHAIDGVDLSAFRAGRAYDLDTSIANFLVISGVAEPCGEGVPAIVVSSEEAMVAVFSGPHALADVVDEESGDD